MEEIVIGIVAFIAGFALGNISKIELRAGLKRVIEWRKNRRKN